jgi:hypothetical protein
MLLIGLQADSTYLWWLLRRLLQMACCHGGLQPLTDPVTELAQDVWERIADCMEPHVWANAC